MAGDARPGARGVPRDPAQPPSERHPDEQLALGGGARLRADAVPGQHRLGAALGAALPARGIGHGEPRDQAPELLLQPSEGHRRGDHVDLHGPAPQLHERIYHRRHVHRPAAIRVHELEERLLAGALDLDVQLHQDPPDDVVVDHREELVLCQIDVVGGARVHRHPPGVAARVVLWVVGRRSVRVLDPAGDGVDPAHQLVQLSLHVLSLVHAS
mmetsp:Transcript_26831/g.74951  ORF Transcript_26831/g.74951 Transcript_26831/m.74951 type:complete len:213 (+) Transcript_26831:26-664(+)